MNTTYIKISFDIILVFLAAMIFSIVPELHPLLFGDWFCNGSGYPADTYQHHWLNCDYSGFHLKEWHWGYRHWLWFLMGLCLFALQVVRVIKKIIKSAK